VAVVVIVATVKVVADMIIATSVAIINMRMVVVADIAIKGKKVKR
jgi:hypothetical protein